MSNVITTTIELDLDKLRGQLKTAESDGKASGAKAGKGFGDGLERGLGSAFGGLKRQILGLGAALLGVFGLKEIIGGAAKQEAAVNALNQALKSAGSFSQAASADLQAFASELQRTSTIGDETALEMLALSKAMGATNDQAKDMVQAAANLSAATGISLESAVKNLGKTFAGLTGELGESLPMLRQLSPEALKAGAAIDLINKRFAGSALAETRTFSGAFEQAKNALGDLAEEIGFFVTKSPATTAALNFMAGKFAEFSEAVRKFADSGGMMRVTSTALEIARVFAMVLGPAVEFVINLFKNAGQVIGAVGASIALLASGEFRAAGESIKMAFSDGWDTLSDFSGSAKVNQFIEEFKLGVESAKLLIKDQGRNLATEFTAGVSEGTQWEQFVAAFQDASTDIQGGSKELAKQIKQTIGVGVSNAFAQFGAALANGQNAAEAFGRAILGVFADILIQIGTQTIAAGLGMSAVPVLFGPQGPAAVVTGGIMVAAGGALKALAGGGGASAGGGAPGGGVAVGGTPVGSESMDLTTAVPDETERQAGTTVQVNVQGNVFDRRETGLYIAEVIRESFETEGVKVFT